MPYDGSSNYTLPSNTAAVSAATIQSTKFNSLTQDLEAAINDLRYQNLNVSANMQTFLGSETFSIAPVPTTSDGVALGSASKMWADLFLASGGVINWNNGNVTLTHSAAALATTGAANFEMQYSGGSPSLTLYRTDTHGDAQAVGLVRFYGRDSGAAVQEYARIQGYATLDDAGAEEGELFFGTTESGTFGFYVRLADGALSPFDTNGTSLGTSALMWSDLFLASGAVINFNNGDVTLTHSADLLTLAGGNFSIGTGGVFTAGTIELGAASDTTISRNQAGVAAVEGKLILTQNFAAAQAASSGTTVDFTGIPSWVREIDVIFNQVSLTGTDSILVQLGDSGGVETTGYVCAQSLFVTASNSVGSSTSGFLIRGDGATRVMSGILSLKNMGSNLWSGSGTVCGYSDSVGITAGTKTTSATLDRVRVTVSGANSFDGSGTVTICYR